MIEGLQELGYTPAQLLNLRSRAYTSQAGSQFSLAKEILQCLPKPDELQKIYNNAGTLGVGIVSVCEEIRCSIRDNAKYGPISTLSDKLKLKIRGFLRTHLLGVKHDRTEEGSINVPNYCKAVGVANFTAQLTDAVIPGVFDARVGVEAGLTNVDLYTGIEGSGRPSDPEFLLRLPEGRVATALQTASLLSDLSGSVKQLTDEIGNMAARIDKGVFIGGNQVAAPLLDWAKSVGTGTGVVDPPWDLGDNVGTKICLPTSSRSNLAPRSSAWYS